MYMEMKMESKKSISRVQTENERKVGQSGSNFKKIYYHSGSWLLSHIGFYVVSRILLRGKKEYQWSCGGVSGFDWSFKIHKMSRREIDFD